MQSVRAAWQSTVQSVQAAGRDIGQGIRKWALWLALAQEDITDQHRRTTLGPFWMLLNYLAYTATFVFVFHEGGNLAVYAAYVVVGLLVWFHIMESINYGVGLFQGARSFIQGTTLPITVYVMRQTTQQVIRTAYAVVGCVAVLAVAGARPTVGWLWALPGVALVLVTTPICICFCAFVGAFFADSGFIAINVTRVGMFLTPIFWVHSGESTIRDVLYKWNPFTYYVESVRMPIIYGREPTTVLPVAAIMTMSLAVVTFALMARLRNRLVFVL